MVQQHSTLDWMLMVLESWTEPLLGKQQQQEHSVVHHPFYEKTNQSINEKDETKEMQAYR